MDRLHQILGTVYLEFQTGFSMFRFHNAPFVCFPFAHLGRPCLASRMERAVIPMHYWRDKQSLSSSFLDPGRNLLVKIIC